MTMANSTTGSGIMRPPFLLLLAEGFPAKPYSKTRLGISSALLGFGRMLRLPALPGRLLQWRTASCPRIRKKKRARYSVQRKQRAGHDQDAIYRNVWRRASDRAGRNAVGRTR